RAMARLVHGDDVIIPALQSADGAVEEPRRDFLRLVRLEPRQAAGAHALEGEHDAGATALALLHARIEAEVSELHLGPLHEPVIRRHVRPQKHTLRRAHCYYSLLTFPCEGRPKPQN